MIEDPLLLSTELRVQDSDGRLHAIRDLQLTTARVGLVGPWQPLFRLLGGEYTLAGGALRIGGVQVPQELDCGSVGVALRPIAWPTRWTVRDLLTTSAELAGVGRRKAEIAGRRALAVLGLPQLHAHRLSGLSEPEARSVKLAEALITDPAVLVVEAPVDQVDPNGAYWMLEALRRASAGRRLVVSFDDWPTTAAGHSLLHAMDTVAQLRNDSIDAWAQDETAAARRRYRLVLVQPAHPLVEALEDSGWSLNARPSMTRGMGKFTDMSAANEWVVQVPSEETIRWHIEHLQEVARRVGAAVLEFTPL